jgi:phospholipid/cholesterol/gamma-HCH transport system substrate-binding protein
MKHLTKEVKIGLTGIVAITALFFGLNFLKGINLFESNNTYYLEFKDVKQLAKSSPVFADGFDVGIVRNIAYNYNHPGHLIVQIDVNDQMRIPKGTIAYISSGMLGGSDLHLTLSQDMNHLHAPGDTLIGRENSGLMDQAANVMPQVQQIMGKIDTLLTSLNAIAANPNLPGIMNDAKSITENLNQSTRQLNVLLNQDVPNLTGKLNSIGDNVLTLTEDLKQLDLQATKDKVDNTLAEVEQITAKINQKDNTLGMLINDNALYKNIDSTVNSANKLLIDLKEHPKRYVHFSIFGGKE